MRVRDGCGCPDRFQRAPGQAGQAGLAGRLRRHDHRMDRDVAGEGLSPRRHAAISTPRPETRLRWQGKNRKALAFFSRFR